MQPTQLTVVIPSVNGLGDLTGCLEAVSRLADTVRLEILVVDRLGGDVPDTVRTRFPAARLLPVPPDTTIPMMRHLAFLEATGEAVAVIEDHVIVPPHWGQQLLGALGEGHDVVGGTIVNAATTRLLDWGTFLCEYSACLPPLPAGPADWLPGNNVAYRRVVLERYRRVTAEGKWENRLHDAMRADGIQLVRVPGIVVGHKKHFGFLEYLSQRYLYSRSYAGARAAGAPLVRRAAMGVAAFLLPVLLFLRIEAALHSKGVPLKLRLGTLPMMLPFVASWAAGEIVGYWAGGGDALTRVR